jgi:hypothetical protein
VIFYATRNQLLVNKTFAKEGSWQKNRALSPKYGRTP